MSFPESDLNGQAGLADYEPESDPLLRVLVCGGREWNARGPIQRELKARLSRIEIVIDGACRGADTLGYTVAKSLGLPTRRFPANWDRYGKAAGMKRNQQMLDEGRPNLVLAFHRDIEHSRGTADMVRRAKAAGIEVLVFRL